MLSINVPLNKYQINKMIYNNLKKLDGYTLFKNRHKYINYFTKMDYVIKVDGIEVDRIPFVLEDTSGPSEVEVIKEYKVSEGQVIKTYVEAEDAIGLHYTYELHNRTAGTASTIGDPPYMEKVTIVDADGNLVYANDESEEW